MGPPDRGTGPGRHTEARSNVDITLTDTAKVTRPGGDGGEP
jgi:hypothetical protein